MTQATMVTEQYSHILDDDRRLNAERLQNTFYGGKPSEEPKDPLDGLDSSEKQALLLKLLADNPAMAAILKNLAQAG